MISLTHCSISVGPGVNLIQVLKLSIISLKDEEMAIVLMKRHATRKHFYKRKWCDFVVLIHQRAKSRANSVAWRGNILLSAVAKHRHFTWHATFSTVHLISTTLELGALSNTGAARMSALLLFLFICQWNFHELKFVCLFPEGLPCHIKCSLLILVICQCLLNSGIDSLWSLELFICDWRLGAGRERC